MAKLAASTNAQAKYLLPHFWLLSALRLPWWSGSRSDSWPAATETRRHRHVVVAPEDPFLTYGVGTAAAVGMIHGVGAETPTQVLLLVSAAGVGGTAMGLLLLAVFVAGLLILVSAITLVLASTSLWLRSLDRQPAKRRDPFRRRYSVMPFCFCTSAIASPKRSARRPYTCAAASAASRPTS